MTSSAFDCISMAIDMHVHFGPDVGFERRFDAYGTALEAERCGLRAIVLKNHSFPTSAIAAMVGRQMENIHVFGGVCLDDPVGGPNPYAVETCAKTGGKVVWMPTFSADHDLKKRGVTGRSGVRLLDTSGVLKPEVREILSLARDYGLVVGTGHVSREEIYSLAQEAKNLGFRKLVVTHPCTLSVGATLSLEEQRELADMGCWLEHCFVATMPMHDRLDPRVLAQAIRYVGASRCVMASDFGQLHNPPPPEGLRMFVLSMLRCGLREDEIDLMIRVNPARLLDLE